MNSNPINCVNENGDAVNFEPLRPFLKSIEPAFLKHATEITFWAIIPKSPTEQPKPFAHYEINGLKYELEIDKDFHPFVTSSRIRLLVGVSIAITEGTRKGKFRLRFKGQLIDVKVRIVLHDNCETLILNPDWRLFKSKEGNKSQVG